MDDREEISGAVTNASETTPLLATGNIAPAADPKVAPAIIADAPHTSDDEKPLPKLQIFLLCYARLLEPVAFFSIFPYVNQMAQDNGNLADTDAGFYSGLIESLFSLTQMIVMIFWGKAADRYGRKPVLVISLFGVTLATAVFGMATTIWQMIFFRCLAGVFAGTIVTIRTMTAELSTPKTQARAFSFFAFAGNLGIFLGPLLGGSLADPARQYGGVFKEIQFFSDYPYALSGFIVSLIGATSALAISLFLEETLQREPNPEASSNGETGATPAPKQNTSTRQLVKSPGVEIVLFVSSYVMLLGFAYTAIVPVWWYTKVPLGGLGFLPLQISLCLCLNGAAQAFWLLFIFPPLQKRIGTNGVMRSSSAAWPFFLAVCPLANLLLRRELDAVFWSVYPPLLVLGSGVSMGYTAIQLAVNDVTPSPRLLGTLNALSLTLMSGIRAFSPASFASLFAFGARTQWLDGYALWLLMIVLAAGYAVATRYLPDYERLKADREEAAERR